MNRNYLASLFLFIISFFHLSYGGFGDNPASKLVEIQLQNAVREQQQLATRLIRAGILQVESASKQLQKTNAIQTIATNTLATKGLFDLNNIDRLISLSDIRVCYQQNRFTFGDALNTAKDQAGQCLSDKLNEAKSIVEAARNNIQSAFENIANGATMLAECNRITLEFPTVAGVVAKAACLQEAIIIIKSTAIILPINIGKRILDATESIALIESDIARCNLNIVEAIVTQSTNAARAIANCISAKNNGTTESSSANSTYSYFG